MEVNSGTASKAGRENSNEFNLQTNLEASAVLARSLRLLNIRSDISPAAGVLDITKRHEGYLLWRETRPLGRKANACNTQ